MILSEWWHHVTTPQYTLHSTRAEISRIIIILSVEEGDKDKQSETLRYSNKLQKFLAEQRIPPASLKTGGSLTILKVLYVVKFWILFCDSFHVIFRHVLTPGAEVSAPCAMCRGCISV